MPSLRRFSLGLLILILAFSMAEPTAGQTKPSPDPRGRPEKYRAGQPERYYIWHDDTGWHLRTSNNTQQPVVFKGEIQVDQGSITSVVSANIEAVKKKKKKTDDEYTLNFIKTKLAFALKTSTQEDGLDFKVDERVQTLSFTLYMGGEEHPKKIFIGRKMQNPPDVRFKLSAHPDKTP